MIAVHYTFEEDVVTLVDVKGAPIKAGPCVLRQGDNAARIAKLLAMDGLARTVARSSDVAWVV